MLSVPSHLFDLKLEKDWQSLPITYLSGTVTILSSRRTEMLSVLILQCCLWRDALQRVSYDTP